MHTRPLRTEVFSDEEKEALTGATVLDPEELDAAILGEHEGSLVYSYEGLITAYMRYFESDDEDEDVHLCAVEWVDYNTVRAIPYLPDPKPIILADIEDDSCYDPEELFSFQKKLWLKIV